MSDASSSTRATVTLAAAVQLVVLLDFALILPLGPDLSEPLAISPASLGLLVGVYTGVAALSGLLGARVLDRFDRRRVMLPSLLGLALAGLVAALAPSFAVLVGARGLAGLCAAPLSASLLSLIADEVPDAARGRALGVVLSANAVAGVVGVPSCLWLAERVGWRAAFAVVALVAVVVALGVGVSARRARPRPRQVSRAELGPARASERGLERRAHALTFLAFASAFALTPNLSAYVQLNLGYPRSDLPLLYMIAGCCSFVAMRMTGVVVDRRGAAATGSVAIATLAVVVAVLLGVDEPLLPLEPVFVVLLVCLGSRNVALRTLTTRVPEAARRGRFMAHQATAHQLGAVAGVLLGMAFLRDRPDGGLAGMQALARGSIALLVLLPLLLWSLERGLDPKRRAP